MEVKAATTYDYDALRALVHLSAYRKKNPKTYLIVSVVSSLLFITAITLFLVFIENDIYFVLTKNDGELAFIPVSQNAE